MARHKGFSIPPAPSGPSMYWAGALSCDPWECRGVRRPPKQLLSQLNSFQHNPAVLKRRVCGSCFQVGYFSS
jgi:hypothetical protein